MTFDKLVRTIALRTGKAQSDVREVLSALPETVAANAANGDETTIPKLVVFYPHYTAARNGAHPVTREPLVVAARTSIKARVSESIRTVSYHE